ncbi:response regulator transcription factor [Pseudomonas sp. RIT-To-2]|uniref:response regulator transcription factor n=1 Tax=Pseudomonas sp. RIT-To-2 TaxID=3462541 RepID=UPI0024139D26
MRAAPARPPIHIAMVEGDALLQDALLTRLAALPDMRMVAVAGSRAAGLAMLEGPAAHVLLVELTLPDGPGMDVIQAAQQRWPACEIMVTTALGDEAHVMRALQAGASGYRLKGDTRACIVADIRSLRAGGSPLSPQIARQLVQRLRPRADAPRPLVSPREQEVLVYLTKGFTAEEIAALMAVSRHTVLTFVRRVYKKLGVGSKAEAIYEARSMGLIER